MNIIVAGIDHELQKLGTPERAVSEKSYLKSQLVHYGTSVPNIRAVVKRSLRTEPELTHDELIELCAELWASGVHEQRVAAVEAIVARPDLVGTPDLAWIESLLRSAKTWALVDELARKVVANVVLNDLSALDTLDRWVTDPDFWIRRSALLALSKLVRQRRELDRLFRYADALLSETEFFIRKAIGWVTREVGQQDPGRVADWLRRNLVRMNGVTLREAVKYLPDGDEIVLLWKSQRQQRSPTQSTRRNMLG